MVSETVRDMSGFELISEKIASSYLTNEINDLNQDPLRKYLINISIFKQFSRKDVLPSKCSKLSKKKGSSYTSFT